MTDATCTPLRTLGAIADREQKPDRLAELLDCMAELMVETAKLRAGLEQHRDQRRSARIRSHCAPCRAARLAPRGGTQRRVGPPTAPARPPDLAGWESGLDGDCAVTVAGYRGLQFEV